MKDIGGIEKRVGNLEYYTSLTLLEQDTLNKQDLTILDSSNLARFKNGIIVDAFKGHSVADVSKIDYKASIDPANKELNAQLDASNKRYQTALDSLGASRDKRIKNKESDGISVADVISRFYSGGRENYATKNEKWVIEDKEVSEKQDELLGAQYGEIDGLEEDYVE